jgi:DNA primase
MDPRLRGGDDNIMIPSSFISDLISRLDIVDVIGKRITLKKMGANYAARCPFHEEKSPSFTVSQTKQFFHCFGCGEHDNAIGFLMKYERLSFVEAIESLAATLSLEVPYEKGDRDTQASSHRPLIFAALKKAADFYYQQLVQQGELAKNYLKDRKVSGQSAKKFQLGYSLNSWDKLKQTLVEEFPLDILIEAGLVISQENDKLYDRFRHRLMFPIRDRQGRVIGFGARSLGDELPKYLNSPETPVFHKGSELYGLYETLEANRHVEKLIVVEGYMDVIALFQAGITYAVATLGTAMTAQNIEKATRETKHLIFCFDGDSAGKKAAWRAFENTLPLMKDEWLIEFVFLPEEHDPDSFVNAYGSEGFLLYLKKALSISEFFFKHLTDTLDLTVMENRSRLAKLAEPYLKELRAPLLRSLWIKELSKLTALEEKSIEQLAPLVSTVSSEKKPVQSLNLHKLSALQKLLALLIQYPKSAGMLSEENVALLAHQPEGEALNKLLHAIEEGNTSTGMLLEYFRGQPIETLLSALSIYNLLLGENEAIAEAPFLLDKIVAEQESKMMATWREKLAAGTLSIDEKSQYVEKLKVQKTKK